MEKRGDRILITEWITAKERKDRLETCLKSVSS